MDTIFWIIGSTVLISILSFVGAITLFMKEKMLKKILLWLVAFSAGALMGGAFIHLLPEVLDKMDAGAACSYVLGGFIIFFFIEKFLHWRHCHEGKCEVHTFAYMNLIGDAVHNFMDGLIIAASFVTDIGLGITTSIAIAAHEIPQELGDFGVLVYGGFSVQKALLVNFLSALTAIFGGITGYFIYLNIEKAAPLLLVFAAGGFIYISASDLIPEIRKVVELSKILATMSFFLAGIAIMIGVKVLFGG